MNTGITLMASVSIWHWSIISMMSVTKYCTIGLSLCFASAIFEGWACRAQEMTIIFDIAQWSNIRRLRAYYATASYRDWWCYHQHLNLYLSRLEIIKLTVLTKYASDVSVILCPWLIYQWPTCVDSHILTLAVTNTTNLSCGATTSTRSMVCLFCGPKWASSASNRTLTAIVVVDTCNSLGTISPGLSVCQWITRAKHNLITKTTYI